MNRKLALCLIFTALILGIFSVPCYADRLSRLSGISEAEQIAIIQSNANLKVAELSVKKAYIYGGAIAFAGLAIGMGLYFGLRSKSQN